MVEEYIEWELYSVDVFMDGENMFLLTYAREIAMIELADKKKFSPKFLEKYGEENSKKINMIDMEMKKSIKKINNYNKQNTNDLNFLEVKNFDNKKKLENLQEKRQKYLTDDYQNYNNNNNYDFNQSKRAQNKKEEKIKENSGVDLNISGIADDLISIKNEESIKEKEIDYTKENLKRNKNNEGENKKIDNLYERQLESYKQYISIKILG